LSATLPNAQNLWLYSIIIVGVLTLIYTFEGGIAAVIWTDLIQLVIYIAGSLLAAYELLRLVPGGWAQVVAQAAPQNKFQMFSFVWDMHVPFTFWAGLLGGTFLTMASHGTDQLLVQRLLTCRNQRDSQKALITSGFVVFFQFALFLAIGVMLYAFYESQHLRGSLPLTSNDEIFPFFIVRQLPHGIAGLVIAAIFAAAMSNLSGSLNSLASSTLIDFYKQLLRLSRWFTVAWGVVLIAIAILSKGFTKSVLNTALSIASLPYGAMLGAFLLGVLTRRANQRGVMTGMAVSLVCMLCVWYFTALAWTWFVLAGTTVCVAVGYAVSALAGGRAAEAVAAGS
jgi:Na+/proline symporter